MIRNCGLEQNLFFNNMSKTKLLKILILLGSSCYSGILPSIVFGQQDTPNKIRRTDVLLNPSLPGLVSCFEVPKDERDVRTKIWIRLTNNYVWTLQFPAHTRGAANITQSLSNGREVEVLKKDSVFYPGYGLESKSGNRIISPISVHVGTVSFLPSSGSALFSVSEDKSDNRRLYLDFNYEWELNTVYQASPTHRFYIGLDDSYRTQNRCIEQPKS
jgi:hypothetical protein